MEDGKALGGTPDPLPLSAATFVVSAVWWRTAQIEEPLGYLRSKVPLEQLAALLASATLEVFASKLGESIEIKGCVS